MEKSNLVRGIGKWDLTAIAINTIIGAGIFGLPAKVYALIGTYSLFAFILCAIIIGLIVLCFAEVSSRFQSTGGMYLYAKEAFGGVVGFEVGWLYWIVRIATFAANCNLLLDYFGFFYPLEKGSWLRMIAASLILSSITVINFIGVRESAFITNIFTAGKIIPLILFAAIGIFFIQPENFSFGALPQYGAFSSAVLLLIYAYVGFEAAVIPAGETKDPEKNVPFALISALIFAAILFILIQIVAIGNLPGLAASERPLADSATIFLGSFGASFITIGALISILGNLNGGFLTSTRIPFAMAEQKELPGFIGGIHQKFKTPYISIAITAIITLIVTLRTDFISALTIATTTRLIVYATTCTALPIFRNREDMPKAKFIAPFGVVAAIASLGLIAWLLSNVDFQKEGFTILVAIEAGLLIGLLNSIYQGFIKKRAAAN